MTLAARRRRTFSSIDLPLIDRFVSFARRHSLLVPCSRVLAAVSGGPDSMALLKLLLIVRRKLRLDVQVAHANHGLRAKASDADERFVRDFCRGEKIPFHNARLPVRRFAASRGLSTEEAARLLRYRYLIRTARRIRASRLATAHTRDDQAETVLMRMIRGAGLKGLASIPESRAEGGVIIIRPLLGIAREDVIAFLRGQGVPHRVDATNRDPQFLRNRVRGELLPLIENAYNPQFGDNLVELSRVSAELYDYVHREAASAYPKLAHRTGRGLFLSGRKLRKLHPALRPEVYFLAFQDMAGSRRSFDKAHLEALEMLLDGPTGAMRQLPRRLIVKRTKDSLVLRRARRRRAC